MTVEHVIDFSIFDLGGLTPGTKFTKRVEDLRGISHFHFYENLVAANLGMRFTL